MHLKCKCGNYISDTADCLCYKARIMTDNLFFNITNTLAEPDKMDNDTLRKAVDDVYEQLWWNTITCYQCPECGTIIIDDHKIVNDLIMFTPSEHFEDDDPRKQLFYPQKNTGN